MKENQHGPIFHVHVWCDVVKGNIHMIHESMLYDRETLTEFNQKHEVNFFLLN